ncbi:MAG: PaaI family thioesterase [Cyanobacteria bacterium NC_groundwater_1444_Ag_S-0.65um_54_12]|nr:PaaI family thioesterase [Cyanobacteria bacterium NC_groundwater_1444_Ag_S-0.65um_54_12]
MQQLPWHGPCFTCGLQRHASGMGVTYFEQADGIVVAEATFNLAQQGPPGHAHGGSLAAVLDEAMGWAVWRAGYRALAVKLEFEYRHPTPLGVPLRFTASLTGRGNRSIRAAGQVCLPDGTITAVGKGVFVELGERFVERFKESWGGEPPGPQVGA